ncbi:MAG: cell envelope integrity protein TolA [Oligoflexia bacterium]|nr:cell envelope integrity protein TolA [Oligoflexia bacterium]
MVDTIDRDYRTALAISLVGHVALALIFFLNLAGSGAELARGIVYSVSIEGGKSLGGISQVAKDNKPSQVAPPKKAAKVEKGEQVKEKPKAEKAEVNLQPKKEQKKEKAEVKKGSSKTRDVDTAAEVNKQLEAAMQRYRGESSDAGGKGFGAGALGGKAMGGGVVLPPEAMIYRDALKNAIKEGWRWYDTSAALTTTVMFDIAPDGVVSNITMVTSSGNREYDDSVLRAIYKASPVPAPPEKVYEYFKKVRMLFDPRE